MTRALFVLLSIFAVKKYRIDRKGCRFESCLGTTGRRRNLGKRCETLDHLAPDNDVAGQQGFKLEQNQTRPAMKQKVRYVMISRDRTISVAVNGPEPAHTCPEVGLWGELGRTLC